MIQKQTKLEDFEAFKLIVESYNIMVKSFREKNRKMESKAQKQAFLSRFPKNKP